MGNLGILDLQLVSEARDNLEVLWKNPKTNPVKNQAVTRREGELNSVTRGPRGANTVKVWDKSTVTTFLIHRVLHERTG